MTGTATDYLRAVSDALGNGYPDDCVAHACRLAELLLGEGESPWIGRLRDVRHDPSGTFHGPLIPKRLVGRNARTWTTHYVACVGGTAYDPLAGMPAALTEYAISVFGREIPIERFLDSPTTAELSRRGELQSAFRARQRNAGEISTDHGQD